MHERLDGLPIINHNQCMSCDFLQLKRGRLQPQLKLSDTNKEPNAGRRSRQFSSGFMDHHGNIRRRHLLFIGCSSLVIFTNRLRPGYQRGHWENPMVEEGRAGGRSAAWKTASDRSLQRWMQSIEREVSLAYRLLKQCPSADHRTLSRPSYRIGQPLYAKSLGFTLRNTARCSVLRWVHSEHNCCAVGTPCGLLGVRGIFGAHSAHTPCIHTYVHT